MTLPFTINPPRTPMVDPQGNVQAPWYRWFVRLQGSSDTAGNVANSDFLTLTPSADLPSGRQFVPAPGQLTAADGGAGSTYTLGLADTAVTPNPYGGASKTVSFTVDAKGRIVAAAEFTLSTTNITEGAKLFYTDARARAALSGGTGITYNSGTGAIALDTANSRNVDHTGVTLTAGAGLTGGGDISSNRTFDIGAGAGITVNANDVALTLPTASGTYTPTLTNVTNLDASTAFRCNYMRVGDMVTVSGKADIDPTAAAITTLAMSLPIASNFADDLNASGTACASNVTGESGIIRADATNDRVELTLITGSAANHSIRFSYTYQII